MKNRSPLGWLLVVLGGLAATGCIATPDDDDVVGPSDEPALHTDAFTQNAFTQNAFTQNAFTQNALTQTALTQSPLTQSSLAQNALTQAALNDPNARELFSYVVSCALPAGSELSYAASDGNTYTFDGSLGLAPEWGQPNGRCNELCQQYVSGCVLSRLDYVGEHVTLSVRGANPALTVSWPEYTTYTQREATYYGNIFSQQHQYLACLPPGVTTDPRVCGPSLDDCVIKFTGSCDQVCTAQAWTGAYLNCKGPLDHNENGVGQMIYPGTITVYLKP